MSDEFVAPRTSLTLARLRSWLVAVAGTVSEPVHVLLGLVPVFHLSVLALAALLRLLSGEPFNSLFLTDGLEELGTLQEAVGFGVGLEVLAGIAD
jgi:hypothetical protein